MDFLYFLVPLRTPILVELFQLITYLGQEIFATVIICWLYWCVNKRLAYTLGFTYFISGLLVQGLKITFRIPRPWVIDPNFPVIPSALSAATGYSFPSGHTQSSTALFSTLGFYAKHKVQKALCALAFAAVGFSRMFLGCHTPKDVLTAMSLTFLISWLCFRYFYSKEWTRKQDGILSLLFVTLSLLLAFYAYYLYSNSIIELKYARDCCKAAGAGLGFSLGYYVERSYIRFSLPTTGRQKVFRLLAGLSGALLIQEGLKPIIGASLPASFLRYLAVILWVLILYPLLFTRFSTGKSQRTLSSK